VTKEPRTDMFAQRFHEARFSVLAFDYRRLGESGGSPRQVLPVKDPARRLAPRSPTRQRFGDRPETGCGVGVLATGGHIFRVAADSPHVSAAIA
jgi:hypothetical protein